MKKAQQKLINFAKNNVVLSKIVAFLYSWKFSVVYAAIAFLLSALGLDLVGFIMVVVPFAFVCLFCEDTAPTMPLLAMTVFFVSIKNSPQKGASGYRVLGVGRYAEGAGSDYYGQPFFYITISVCVALVVAFAIYRLITGDWKRLADKRSLSFGIGAFCLSCFLGGAIGGGANASSLIVALSITAGLAVVYVFLRVTAKPENLSFSAVANLLTTMMFYVMALVVFIYVTRFAGFLELSVKWKARLLSGWGMSNDFGIFLSMTLPLCFYKAAHTEKRKRWYIAACANFAVTYFTLCRSAIIAGGVILIAGTVWSIIKQDSRAQAVSIFASFAVVVASYIGFLALFGGLEWFFDYFITKSARAVQSGTDGLSSGRIDIWTRYLRYFIQNPIFGGGFTVDAQHYIEAGAQAQNGAFNAFSYFAHNTVIQMLGSCGIVGFAAWGYHTYTVVRDVVYKPDPDRVIFGVAIAAFIFGGLLDVAFFKPEFLIWYALLLLAVECDYLKVRDAAGAVPDGKTAEK